jgi:hypothetical protein
MNTEVEERAHSEWGPSGYDRWSQCAGSIEEIRLVPAEERNRSSSFADEGTAAHYFAEQCLTLDCNAEDIIGLEHEVNDTTYTLDEEMAGYIQVYLDHVRAHPGTHYIEERVAVPGLPEHDNKGTADFIAADLEAGVLYVDDLKYGQGVKVYADKGQLKLYALGALARFQHLPFDRVVMTIVQPRLDWIDSHEMTVEELQAFGVQVAAEVQATLQPGAPRVPGEHCRWCPAKPRCRALAEHVKGLAAQPASGLTPEELGAILPQLDLISSWVDADMERANGEIRQGNRVPGWKLVLGREGNRKWASEEEAEKLLQEFRIKTDLMYERKVISPTSAEKIAVKSKKNPDPAIGPRQWTKLQALITRAPAAPTLVPADDPRAPCVFTPPSAADMPDLEAQEPAPATDHTADTVAAHLEAAAAALL